MGTSTVLESVGWVCVRDGRLLVVRTRGRDAFYLPGGKLERGETPAQALAREVAEELGLSMDPAVLRELFVVDDVAHGRAGRRLRMRVFAGPAAGRPQPAGEIAELAWAGRDDEQRCAPAVRQVLRCLSDLDEPG